MTPPSSTPEAITELIAKWKTDKTPAQEPIPWNRKRWEAPDSRYPKVANHSEFIGGLPNLIGREDVRRCDPTECGGEEVLRDRWRSGLECDGRAGVAPCAPPSRR